jgi:hypothetical protein
MALKEWQDQPQKDDPELLNHLRHFIITQFGLDPGKITEEQWYEIESYVQQL